MQQLPFDKPGQFYKGNLHVHSTHSDGKISQAEVIESYKAQGYDFISLTDHLLPHDHFRKGEPGIIPITDTTHQRDDSFTTLIGAEIHAGALGNGERWHLVAAGLPLDFEPWIDGETGPQIAERAARTGAFVGIAHPAWYSLSIDDALQVAPFADAVEIYNHACQGVDRAESWHFADALSERGCRLTAFASDDAHFKDPRGTFHDAFGGWVQVKAESRTPEAILAALKAGAYYASTGPEIVSIGIDGDHLTIESSPASVILVTSRGACSEKIIGDDITEARVPLTRFTERSVCRVTIIDAAGKRAWSNPIWLD